MSGYLKDGRWHEGWYDTGKTAGEFVRTTSNFRSWITADGSTGSAAEPGRYHLYVSFACPWVLSMPRLKSASSRTRRFI